jgi:hypothetical protein
VALVCYQPSVLPSTTVLYLVAPFTVTTQVQACATLSIYQYPRELPKRPPKPSRSSFSLPRSTVEMVLKCLATRPEMCAIWLSTGCRNIQKDEGPLNKQKAHFSPLKIESVTDLIDRGLKLIAATVRIMWVLLLVCPIIGRRVIVKIFRIRRPLH